MYSPFCTIFLHRSFIFFQNMDTKYVFYDRLYLIRLSAASVHCDRAGSHSLTMLCKGEQTV